MPDDTTQTRPRRLYRSRDVRVIGGVCGGLADYLNVDVVITRIIALALLVSGSGFVLYVLAWIIVPEEPKRSESAHGISIPVEPEPPRPRGDGERSRWLLGGVLIAVGSWFIIRNVADDLIPWLDDLILPMALIAIGTAVVVYALKK